eukprot:tig00000169_g11913.t1
MGGEGAEASGGTGALLREVRELLQTAPPGLDEAAALSKAPRPPRPAPPALPPPPSRRGRSSDHPPAGQDRRHLQRRQASVFGKEVPKGEGAMARLERFQARMQRLQNLFRDGSQCEFVVVSIPTVLAASESERLVAALRREGFALRTAVVVPAEELEAGGAGAAAGFAQRVARQHARTLEHLRTDPALAGLQVIAVPYFDAEVRGVYGLRSLAAALLPPPAP